MRKWNAFLDKGIIREIGDTLGLTPKAFARENPIEVVAVDDVLKELRTIKNTLEMSEDDPDECAIDEVHCLILRLEKKSGGE